jgi:hypothetical protein
VSSERYNFSNEMKIKAHGCRLSKQQMIRMLGDELSELEKQIDDEEVEWKGLVDDDYVFLAVALLGINENYFNKNRIRK